MTNTDTAAEVVYLARSGTRRLVNEVLRATQGANGTTPRPAAPGLSSLIDEPADWVQGITAARRVRAAAQMLVVDYARNARAEGVAWRDLADPLGIEAGEWDDPATLAFEMVAGEPLRRFDDRWTSWRCTSCEQRVTDKGPYGHPTDCETGHADGCTRHAAEIAAYRAGAGFDDEEEITS